MAPHAGEPRARYASALIGLFEPRPGRLELAMRLAIICALTVGVTEVYQTPDPALTAYIVFFLNREDRTISLIMNAVLLAVITVVIGLILLVAMAVLDDPMWRVTAMTLISFFLLFLTSASKLRPLGNTIALIVGYGLDLLGRIQVGELGTRALLYAWLFVGIPAGVSIVVNLLIAPAPRRLAERAIAQRLKLCAAMLQQPDEDVRRGFEESLREGAGEIQSKLKLAEIEKTSTAEDLAALREAADSTVVLLSAVDVTDRNPEAALPAATREYLARTMNEMAAMVTAGGRPAEIAWAPPVDERPPTALAAGLLDDIRDALNRFAGRPAAEPAPQGAESPAQEAPKEASGFFLEDAFTNPDHVQYALRTTAAAMFCYVLYHLLDWNGIHTSFITCYIVSLATAAESVEKLTLRILGCLVGAAAGLGAIIFLVPSLTSIGDLMLVVLVGAFASGYVAAGSPRISYAGFQIAFAFFLSVIQGPAPAFDMTIARDRTIGILLGNVVSYLALTSIWPVSVGRRIDPAIAALLRRLGAMMRTTAPSARRALASQALSALAAIETDIDLAAYETGSVRPPEDWLLARRRAAHEIGALAGPLLLAAGEDATLSARVADRLEALAGRFAPAADVPAAPSKAMPAEWNKLPLFGIIDGVLRRLEEAPTARVEPGGG